jgi:flavin reductase (DIM6/NTAB) family NADH-FMN oxidoreductase RutF
VPSADELRAVMRRFPAGVAVLTVSAERERAAVTVGSVVSLSLEPPLVGVALGVHTPLHEVVRDTGLFGLSLLGAGQAAVAQHFARGGLPPIALWHGIETRTGTTGVPLLAEAAGWLECRLWSEAPAGDHTLFVGEVVAAEPGPVSPGLVYLESAFQDLQPQRL